MRVDLLLHDRRCYTYENWAAREVCGQLDHRGISHKVIYLGDGCLQDYLIYAQQLPPSWTLCFTNPLPLQTPLCDIMRTPQFLWLEGSFSQGIHYVDSTFGRVGIGNESLCQKLSSPKLCYLPHGVNSIVSSKKMFDLVLFADLIALSFLEKTWQELFSEQEIGMIQRGVETVDPLVCLSKFYHIEKYLHAKQTVQAVTLFQEVSLHVFGEHAGANWLVQLPKNLHLHTALPFSEHLEVLKASKLILATPDSPWYLPAIASGCLPVIPNEEEVKFYLKYPHQREARLEKLQNALQECSWKKQVDRLLTLMKKN